MVGETVYVQKKTRVGEDERKNPVYYYSEESVENVLIAPGEPSDIISSTQDGDEVLLTLHFPKTYTSSLAGLRVRVYGDLYKVIGDPRPYQEQNTPGEWNRPVKVRADNG